MGFAKALVLVQLSVLLLSCFTVFGEDIQALPPVPPRHHGYHAPPVAAPSHPPTHGHHHHPHPPTASPVHPPVHSPSHAPAHPPTHHHHAHPPSHSPVHSPYPHPPTASPAHPPVHSPAHAPAHPPTHHHHAHPPTHHAPPAHSPVPVHPPTYPPKQPFPRSFVAVQGVVFCKSCKYSGVDTLLNATAVAGASVKLQCNNTKYPLVVKGTTDKNGYFFITAPKTITTYGAHKCKVWLVSAPTTGCSKITDLHGGLSGAVLRPTKPFVSDKKLPFLLYTVGPFAFESKCPR